MAGTEFNLNLEDHNFGTGMFHKMKEEIKLPSSLKRRVSLSDIIAATIGEEARSSDFLYSDHENTFYVDSAKNYIFNNKFSAKTDKHNEQQNTGNMFSENSSNACDLPDNGFQTKGSKNDLQNVLTDISLNISKSNGFSAEDNRNEFTTAIGFDTEIDFISTLFGADQNNKETSTFLKQSHGTTDMTGMTATNTGTSQTTADTSYDSDLEDSMHFVDPDEGNNDVEPQEPVSKKQRVSLHDSTSCPFPITSENVSNGSEDFLSLISEDFQVKPKTTSKSIFRLHGGARSRSFSGNITPKLSRQSGKCNLLNRDTGKLSNFGRTRSFSEACNRDEFSPLGEGNLNSSLSSLLESQEGSPLGNNPFFKDLKSLLMTDCNTMDCPKTLFETLSNKPKQDVYARERNLQSKFSSLQAKYPDEVRELSSFYRQQSAEVETERLKEIHDENVPLSYRNHLNTFYDNQLHMIMERVEKSLSLLAIAKREIITINRPFKSRPLLSRKAVKMMEEWYSRNYEHPYPGPTAVEALSKAGEITTEQVKKWFANKRNRCKNTKPAPEIANMKRKRQFSARW